jgi:hypothetical protein
MQRWNNDYGVFIENRWQWFSSYQEAARAEAEQPCRRVRRNLQAGGTVILVEEQIQQYARARSLDVPTEASQVEKKRLQSPGAKPHRAAPSKIKRKTR